MKKSIKSGHFADSARCPFLMQLKERKGEDHGYYADRNSGFNCSDHISDWYCLQAGSKGEG